MKCFLALAPLFLLAASGTSYAASLDFNSLPSGQGWTYNAVGVSPGNFPESATYSLTTPTLTQHMVGLGTGGGNYTLGGVVDTNTDFALDVRARATDSESVYYGQPGSPAGGFIFNVYTGTQLFTFGLTENGVYGSPTALLTNAIDTTQFHDYRLEGAPSTGAWSLYADNLLIASGTANASTAPNQLFFGDGTSYNNVDGEIAAYSYNAVPEPASVGLLMLGLLGTAAARRRRG